MLKRSISTWLRYTPLQKSGSLSHQFTIVIPTEKFFASTRNLFIPCKAVAAMRNLYRWCSECWKDLSQPGFDTPRYKKAGHSATNLPLSFRQRSFFTSTRNLFIPCKAVAAMRNLYRWCSECWKDLSQPGFDTPRYKKAGHSATNSPLSFRQRSCFCFDEESLHSVQGGSRDAESL